MRLVKVSTLAGAVHALEATGPQEYNLKPGPLAERLAAAYGDSAAADVATHLPA